MLVFGSAWLGMSVAAQASPITPDPNGATQVTQTGEIFSITGGHLSGDAQTLFHTFTEFGLTSAQAATFLTQPHVQSILGSINSGQASYIDGLLQVTGGVADLYLMNPAGVLLGPNAQLDLAGSFAATTASGVLFDEQFFNVLGPNDYSQFAGTPTGFTFVGGSGAVVSAADLTVLPGEAITLMGGQVIITGTLTAPGGEITIAAIPDRNLVRISQTDMALSLELAALPADSASSLPFEPLTLPALLTGNDIAAATGITTNPDGTIALVNTAVADVAGTAIATGTLDTSSHAGGDITLVGDRVSLLGATVNASGDGQGGSVRLGGDVEGQSTLPGSTLTYVDAGSAIAADSLLTGNGGTVILWSDDTTALLGDISAQGGAQSGDGGFVEVSGARSLVFAGDVITTAPWGNDGELLLDPTDIIIRNGIADGDDSDGLVALLSESDIAVTDPIPTIIFESELEGLGGDTALTLRASNSITIEDLVDNELTFAERSPILLGGVPIVDSLAPDQVPPDPAPIRFESGGAFTMNRGDTLSAPGRDVLILAGGAVTLGDIRTWRDGNDNANVAPSVETDGNLTVVGSTIQAGDLNALQRQILDVDGRQLISGAVGLGGGNASRVYLESTAGDITVDSILAGAGGLVVNAAETFRVEDFFRVEAVSERDANGAAIASDIFDLSIFVAIPLPRDGADNRILPAADQPYFFRGVRIDPNTTGEIAIAFDTQNARRFETLDFFIGPAIAGDGGVAPPPGENGTVAGLLFAEPDRTIVTFLESQLFEPTNESVDTTGLDELSAEDDVASLTDPIAIDDQLLEICEEENTEDPHADCLE